MNKGSYQNISEIIFDFMAALIITINRIQIIAQYIIDIIYCSAKTIPGQNNILILNYFDNALF